MSDTRSALTRTLLLMRDDVEDAVGDEQLVAVLADSPVCIVGDECNLAVEAGQHAFVTAALLCARMGIPVELVAPNVPLQGEHPPLAPGRILDALLDIGDDLIPGVRITEGFGRAETTLLLGDTPPLDHGPRSLSLAGTSWVGHIATAGASRWRSEPLPFGALGAAGLAAGEVFKAVMRKLAGFSKTGEHFADKFRGLDAATVALGAGDMAIDTTGLGSVTMVSGGAIAQACLFALARVRGAEGHIDLVEPESSDLSNLNRYALLRRSRVSMPKAMDLAEIDLGGLVVRPHGKRFDRGFAAAEPSAMHPDVLIGVDHIPSRWAAQEVGPTWLGIGATSHYDAMASYHARGLGCARCLHASDDLTDAPIPTISFVSHWAGLWLAAYFLRHRAGQAVPPAEQQVYMATLQPSSPSGTWRTPVVIRADCPTCGGRGA